MRAIIVSGGAMPNTSLIRRYIEDNSILIACDKGIEYTYAEKLVPDIILGDFDSADPSVLNFYRNKAADIRSYPAKKDHTDTELGIMAAEEKGADDIVLLAASGSRIDHTAANIHLLLPLLKKGIRARLADDNNLVELADNRLEVKGCKGAYISLLPLSDTVEGVTSSGLEYPLENDKITKGSSRTVSNVIISDTAYLNIKKGVIMCIIAYD